MRSLYMESTSYVLSFRMVLFYLVTTGWIFYISLLCEISINQSIKVLRDITYQVVFVFSHNEGGFDLNWEPGGVHSTHAANFSFAQDHCLHARGNIACLPYVVGLNSVSLASFKSC